MIDTTNNLIGPASNVLASLRVLAKRGDKIAVLLDGNPGCGKSHSLDTLAIELTGSKFAVETVNGQSLKIEVVRQWRERAGYGNLFSSWTVKRIDELDQASLAAQSELLTYIDYLPRQTAILATTNDYRALRAISKGRLETRFVRIHVDSPTVAEATKYLIERFGLPAFVATQIAKGAVPEGCLESEGTNMRACIMDAQGFLAAREAA